VGFWGLMPILESKKSLISIYMNTNILCVYYSTVPALVRLCGSISLDGLVWNGFPVRLVVHVCFTQRLEICGLNSIHCLMAVNLWRWNIWKGFLCYGLGFQISSWCYLLYLNVNVKCKYWKGCWIMYWIKLYWRMCLTKWFLKPKSCGTRRIVYSRKKKIIIIILFACEIHLYCV